MKLFLGILGIMCVAELSSAFASSTSVSDCRSSDGAIVRPAENCYSTPQDYEMTIIRIGVCRSEPKPPFNLLSYQTAACHFIVDNPTGCPVFVRIDQRTNIGCAVSRPPVDVDFSSIVIEIVPEIRISANFRFTQPMSNLGGNSTGEVCWSIDGPFYSYRTSKVSRVSCGTNAPQGRESTTTKINALRVDNSGPYSQLSFGSLKAFLVDPDGNVPVLAPDGMGTVTKAIGIVPLSNRITESTVGVDISFNVRQGTELQIDNSGQLEAFGAGPFQPLISFY